MEYGRYFFDMMTIDYEHLLNKFHFFFLLFSKVRDFNGHSTNINFK